MRISDWSSDVCSSDLGLPATWMAGVSSVKKAGSGQRARPGCPGSVVECGIIGVALGAAAIEGGRIERVQCGAGFEPRDEVRVGDEEAAEGDQVGLAVGQMPVGEIAVIAIIGDIGVAKALAERRNDR